MKSQLRPVFASTAILVLLSANSGPALENPGPRMIRVQDFREHNVIGHLGQPLGTVVRVTGVCLPMDSLRGKAQASDKLLEISTCNGQKLDPPFVVAFGRSGKEIPDIKPGEAFDYWVHEWGEFDGDVEPPPSLGLKPFHRATDGFYYRPNITIHKSNTSAAPRGS
jgi:hypothetical protein